MAELKDKTLVCKDCGVEFVFSVGEQEFYNRKGFTNEPSRCMSCRTNRKRQRGVSSENSFKPLVEVTCESCGVLTKVPFKPTQGKPVFCRDCYNKRKMS